MIILLRLQEIISYPVENFNHQYAPYFLFQICHLYQSHIIIGEIAILCRKEKPP